MAFLFTFILGVILLFLVLKLNRKFAVLEVPSLKIDIISSIFHKYYF